MMIKKYYNRLLIIGLSISFISCSFRQLNEEYPAVNEVSVGEKFRITLPEEHNTGYMWQINNAFQSDVLHYKGSVYRGSVKGVDFNFNALTQGVDTIKLSLIKYKDTSSTKVFVVRVK